MLASFLAAAVAPLLFIGVADPSVRAALDQSALRSVAEHRAELVDLANQVWEFAETALHEQRSSALLADYAESQGFAVQRGVAELPTAFVASFGSGVPIIGILAEYDALPGLSQQASAERGALKDGAAGHGCGHNLFGAASLGAALALKELIARGEIQGTIRLYGTPAEEAVGGKIYMARAGLFDDLDVCLAWHPGDKTQADMTSTQAIVDFVAEFRGRTAHAAGDPWNGRSAVDAAELFTHGLNMMREHIQPTSRIHYTIVDGGDVPNVVPDHAKVWVWVRDWKRSEVDQLLARARKCAEGAALMAEVAGEVRVQTGDWELLVLESGARLLHENLLALGPIAYGEDELAFARTLQRNSGVPEKGMDATPRALEGQPQEGGSTDVGDVSWVTPTLHVTVACAPLGVPWHAWPVVASARHSIGHKGLEHAAKVLALTAVDLFTDATTRTAIRAEFEQKRGTQKYVPYIPAGPPPVPAAK